MEYIHSIWIPYGMWGDGKVNAARVGKLSNILTDDHPHPFETWPMPFWQPVPIWNPTSAHLGPFDNLHHFETNCCPFNNCQLFKNPPVPILTTNPHSKIQLPLFRKPPLFKNPTTPVWDPTGAHFNICPCLKSHCQPISTTTPIQNPNHCLFQQPHPFDIRKKVNHIHTVKAPENM